MRRRDAIAALVAGLALVGAGLGDAHAAEARGSDKLRGVERSDHGTTLELWLDHAPFPTKQHAYTDATVLVFVPAHYRLPKGGVVDAVVHFHGHGTTAKEAIASHKLREQVAASRQNAILVVPQGPVRAREGDFGKLMHKGGLERLLVEAVETAKRGPASRAIERAGFADAVLRGATGVGKVVVSSHSGGYRAAAAAATLGGIEVREVYLFDSLYGEVDAFRSYLAAAPKTRKIVSYYVGGRPRELSLELAKQLERAGVAVLREQGGARLSREELTKGRAVFLEGVGPHASATWEELALRDCLFASCLSGRGSRGWHAGKTARRST